MVKEISLGYARFILTNHPVKFESLYNTYFGSSACVILYITLRLVRFIKRLFPSEISISVTVRDYSDPVSQIIEIWRQHSGIPCTFALNELIFRLNLNMGDRRNRREQNLKLLRGKMLFRKFYLAHLLLLKYYILPF